MTIYRGSGSGDAVVVLLRAAAQDSRLSFRARGILLAVMSRPDDWRTSYRRLAMEAREGERAVLAALRELEQLGYLSRPRTRHTAGRLTTGWVITDDPAGLRFLQPGKPQPGEPHTGRPHRGKPHTGKPQRGKPHLGEPHLGEPHLGEPHRGEAQPPDLQLLLGRETEVDTPPPNPPAPDVAAEALADVVVGGLQPGTRPRRANVVIRCRRLAGLGWTPAQLEAALRAEDWTGARGGVVITWLDDLDGPPAAGESSGRRPTWCGQCEQATRMIEDDSGRPSKCPRCHPAMIGAAGGPLPA